MEYGLRRYEATQRLLWFLFFLACLGIAYLIAPASSPASPQTSPVPLVFQPDVFKSFSFWFDLRWLRVQPFGKVMIYLVWVAYLFLGGRLLGLAVQYAGKLYVRNLLGANIKRPEENRSPTAQAAHSAKPDANLPVLLLLKKTDSIVLQTVFHPLRRLRVLLTNPQRTFSAEGLSEKERRLAEMDWEILWSSWTPFRWLVRLLLLVGLVQTVWLLYLQLQPALSGQKDVQELLGLVLNTLLPLIQMIFLAVVFSLASGLLKRLDGFYLSGVDTLFYDRFLTRLPFQSSDTPILLEVLHKNFQELQGAFRRLEQVVGAGKHAEGKEQQRSMIKDE
jgi:hypothetical protein